MNKKIWKYELAITGLEEVKMPKGAKILSVGNQGGSLCLWAMVDPTTETETRFIEILGTGQSMIPINNDLDRTFIGTVIFELFVWHVFERTS